MDNTAYKSLVKHWFLLTVICIFVIASFASVVIILDPLQFFHRSKEYDGFLFHDMRVQAAGILNTFDIDSIILGSSMLENTSATEASAKVGGKFFNISLHGSVFSERSIVLRRALKRNLKHVIYSLDCWYLPSPSSGLSLPAYLYDDNPINDFKYYATFAYIRKLFHGNRGLTQSNLDRPCAWYDIPDRRDCFGGIENWVAHKDNPSITTILLQDLPDAAKSFASASREEVRDPDRERQAKKYVEKYILEVVKGHEGTNFYFIFPPYSRLKYAMMRRTRPKEFFLHQEIVRYLVNKTKENKNIKIYGFEDQDFLDNIANYGDYMHHDQKFNSYFLDAIAAGKHVLTPENVEDYLKKCEQKAWDYDIPALNAKVQSLLRETAEKK